MSDKIVGLVTIPNTDKDHKNQSHCSEKLKSVLSVQLRNGDIFTQWNERQFTLLLYQGNMRCIEDLKQRIIDGYASSQEETKDLVFSFHTIEKFVF